MEWPWKGRERRRYERVKTAVPCRLQVNDRVLTGTTRDLSLGGISFAIELDEAAQKFLAGASGRVNAILPNGTMESDCRVVRVEPAAVAAQFINFKNTPGWEVLHAFLETQVSRISTVVPDGDGEDD